MSFIDDDTAERMQTLFSIKRIPIYYGWVILLIGTIGLVMTSPGQTYAVSIFIEHFITDFGISRSLVSTLYTVATLTASLLLPTVGRLIDLRGFRQMMTFIGIARDHFGSYNLILPLLAIIPLILAIAAIIFGKKPARSENP